MSTMTTKFKRRVAILVAVSALSMSAAGCLQDATPGVPPSDLLQHQVMDGMNFQRWIAGVPGLTNSPKLSWLATVWAATMATTTGFTHQNLSDRLFNDPYYSNYYTLGENILVGPGNMSADQMLSSWMGSTPHRNNILSRNFNIAGVGWFRSGDGRLWVCVDFGGI
jgi:uncharacterized protein YkwD